MKEETQELLARSLTAETTELLPFLPYLLQDFWELGSSPDDIITLMKRHMPVNEDTKVLDLACGKGAVAVKTALRLGVNVYGFDLFSEFIDYAREKAKEFQVDALCTFSVGDVNEIADRESGYDCTIFGAAGNILGPPSEMLAKLKKTVKPGGYIIIDDGYLPEGETNDKVKYKNYEYLTHGEWPALFKAAGLRLAEELPGDGDYDFDRDNRNLAKRAEELILKHPEKRGMFEGYLKSQLDECDDIADAVVSVTWILQREQ